jgi:hypothetical protein
MAGAANDPWDQLTNEATHNAAVIALAPDGVRTIVMRRGADIARSYYSSPEGQRESEELQDWRALDGESFQVDGAEDGGVR